MNLQAFNDLELMIGNMYGEARLQEGDLSDDIREWIAIGSVVKNRTRSPRWPNTFKTVILQPKQFSWTNANDPNRASVYNFLTTQKQSTLYKRMEMCAQAIISDRAVDFSNGADHYVATWLYMKETKASWISKMTITAIWGGHVFLKDI